MVTVPLKLMSSTWGSFWICLILDVQMAMVMREASCQWRLGHHQQPFLDVTCPGLIHLDYCKVLYVGLPLKMVQKPQLTQNATAHMLTQTGRIDYATPLLLGLLVPFYAQFKVLVVTYKLRLYMDT